jgi:hypothetical protein
MDRLTGGPAVLISPLPTSECLRRLSEAVDPPAKWFGERPVIGRIDGSRLRARRRIPYRNSFQTELTAELSAAGGGTRIGCRFGMHPVVIVILLAVLGVFGLGSVATLPGTIAQLAAGSAGDPISWMMAAPPLLAVAGVGAIVAIGRIFAAGERRFLIDFLCETLDAKPE